MIAFALAELARLLDGRLLAGDAEVRSVSTDTRTLVKGDLFVALVGPTFDGHDYLDYAADAGACAALVSRPLDHRLPQLLVTDTRAALGRLAANWRRRAAARVLAITGSNGKTTLKEMLAAVCAQCGAVLATRGNLNNEIGLPLTLTRLQDEDFAVVEMGANHAGEIRYLSNIARPDVAVLNNAGRAHLEGFGSLEGVARAKAEIIEGLGPTGVFVYNADDRFAGLWRELAAGRTTLGFGVAKPTDVSSPADALRLVWSERGFTSRFPIRTPRGEFEVDLALAGVHNQLNALAATAAALAVDVGLEQIAAGLGRLLPVKGRLCPTPGIGGARLIDDSYNANPESVTAAIRVLASAPGTRTLVLGDLAELGDQAETLHAELGRRAREAGVERLVTVGALSEAATLSFAAVDRGEARHFPDQKALIEYLGERVGSDDVVLIKGSRAARMERVVAALAAAGEPC